MNATPALGVSVALLVLTVAAGAQQGLCPLAAPRDLTVEGLTNPSGVDTPAPRLGWTLAAAHPDARDLRPCAWHVLVASSPALLEEGTGDLWDSGRVESDRSIWIPYAGRPLSTGQRCYWKVRAWEAGAPEAASPWSAPALWIMGVMNPADWGATWIGPHASTRPPLDLADARWIATADAAQPASAPPGRRCFRREFEFAGPATGAVALLAVTADDSYEVFINGRMATRTWGHLNRPRWMRFVDVGGYLRAGRNVIAAVVPNKERGPTGLLALLRLPDGQRVPTDGRWMAVAGAPTNWNADVGAAVAGVWSPAAVVAGPDAPPWGEIDRRVELCAPAFETRFTVRRPVRQATMFISGLGYYEATVDGVRVGRQVLDPPPTRYDRRVLYSTHDVTTLLIPGERVWRVLLGHGWYDLRTVAVWNFDNAPWRDVPRLLAQIDIVYDDGTTERVATGDGWRQVASPVGYDCIFEGEVAGARHPEAPDLDSVEVRAEAMPAPAGRLAAASLPPSVIARELAPVSIRKAGDDTWVADFGQNMAGWVRLRLDGQRRGDVVTIRYGERLGADGRVDPVPIDAHWRHAASFLVLSGGGFQTDRVVCDGGDGQVFEPRFVYHGFQYAEIRGLRAPLSADRVRACVVHTAFGDAGGFECSDPLLNRIQQATQWAYRGNFVNGYPTDCPHREKNGWTGDAHLACEAGLYNFDNTAAYSKWVNDLLDEQQPDGNLPGIVPTSGWGYQWGNGPAWDSALVIIPWLLYVYRGDTATLARAHGGMRRYVDFMTARASNGIVSHGLGDWVPAKTRTPVEVTSTGYYYLDARIVARAAAVLGRPDEAARYDALADGIANAFRERFHAGEGRYANGSQTAQSCALHQGLLPPPDRPTAVERLVEAVEAAGRHVDVGILGAKYLFRSLSEAGRTDLALAVARQEDPPSYGAWLRRGATTLWEDWGDGASRNHIMFGDISAWFFQYLAGLRLPASVSAIGGPTDPAAVAFREFVLAPEPVPPLRWVRAWHQSPYGRIESAWRIEDNQFQYEIEIPVGTRALVVLPVPAGTVGVVAPPGAVPGPSGRMAFRLGSGRYRFVSPAAALSGAAGPSPGS